MIGYTCKYMPVEVFQAMGVETVRIDPDVTSYDKAETIMHTNLCSYVKGVLEEVVKNDYEGIVLTTCCDSTRRLYDTIKSNFKDKFVYMLDLPRKVNDKSIKLYMSSIKNMINEYEKYTGCKFEEKRFLEILKKKEEKNIDLSEKINLGLMGARCNDGIIKLVKDSHANVVFNISCTGDERNFNIDENEKEVLYKYTKELLSKIPCVRMEDVSERNKFLASQKDKIDGIIYHTVKFCDIYSYEYAYIKENLNIPILKVETDYTKQCAGQIKTRVEAFIESLEVLKKDELEKNQCNSCSGSSKEAREEYVNRVKSIKADVENEKNAARNNEGVENVMENEKEFYVLGIDSGSTSTNAVIMNNERKIIASYVVRTGAKSSESAKRALNGVLEKANLTREDLKIIISTGYGRVSIDFADKDVTEISCHGRGAHYLNPEIRTIIDIGGQDSKVIKLNEKGEVIDFVMNDKCAAGTGRFLEMMAKTLEIDINDMGKEALKWKEDIKISSMCSVFAESEVISLIAENKEKCDIIHALDNSISSKTNALLGRVGREPKFMMSGGVAQNIGVIKALEEKIGDKIFVPEEPEIVGAIGAALFGLDELINK